jgi:hypothetical protein
MALESALQWWLHAIEQGSSARWVRRAVVTVVFAALALFWLLNKFNGFSAPDAMDQAQIARQIASGKGFTTQYARPLALRVFAARGPVPDPLPEINQAPLGPLMSAAVLLVTGSKRNDFVGGATFAGDMFIAATGMACLLASLGLAFLLGRTLFDGRLALLATGLAVATALLWRFGISGLPQPAMLCFFNGALLCLVFALRASDAGDPQRTVTRVAAAAFLLAMVTLGNGIAVWMFAGFLAFIAVALRPRGLVVPVALGCYTAPLLPWIWHNMRASGVPTGFAHFALMRPAGVDELAFAANFEQRMEFHWGDFLANTAENALRQLTDLSGLLGYNIVAAAFFLAVLFHAFAKWEAAQLRWAVLLMWAAAFAGMSVFGTGGLVSVNQLHILFLPVMITYGLAFLLHLWDRLGFGQPLLRTAFMVLLFAAVAPPMLASVTGRPPRFNWPPYVPPLVTQFGNWLGPDEALASDIPWATAWYAGRRSLLLPESVEQFELIGNEGLLGAPLVAIYLTPASSGEMSYAGIVNGRYRDWASIVMDDRGARPPASWRLRSKVSLPIDGESLFLSDRKRWEK